MLFLAYLFLPSDGEEGEKIEIEFQHFCTSLNGTEKIMEIDTSFMLYFIQVRSPGFNIVLFAILITYFQARLNTGS